MFLDYLFQIFTTENDAGCSWQRQDFKFKKKLKLKMQDFKLKKKNKKKIEEKSNMNKSNEMGRGHREAGWQASKMPAGEILDGKPKTVSHTVAKCGKDKAQMRKGASRCGGVLRQQLPKVISN